MLFSKIWCNSKQNEILADQTLYVTIKTNFHINDLHIKFYSNKYSWRNKKTFMKTRNIITVKIEGIQVSIEIKTHFWKIPRPLSCIFHLPHHPFIESIWVMAYKCVLYLSSLRFANTLKKLHFYWNKDALVVHKNLTDRQWMTHLL